MTSLKGPGKAPELDGSSLRIGIVHARWNSKIIEPLVSGAKAKLLAAGVEECNIVVQSVPGSWELPSACSNIYLASLNQYKGKTMTTTTKLSSAPFDALIAIGVLIKGETMHFEYIADAVSQGLMRVQLDTGIPVIFGVLTVLNEQQAMERAGLFPVSTLNHNHGEDWGAAAVELGVKKSGWTCGDFT